MPEALKPEVAQEIIDWLAIGDFKTPDEFKTNFNKKYLTGDDVLKSKPVKDKIGGIVGTINVELKNIFKSYGIELSSAEIEDEDGNGGKVISPKKIAEVAAKKLQEANNKVQEELKGQIGANTDERLKKWEENFNKLKTDSDAKDKIILTAKEEKELLLKQKEEAEKQSQNKINDYIRSDKEKSLFTSFAWADEANDLTKAGFESSIRKIAKFELDEKGNFIARNIETGEQFEDPTKKGVFLTPEDLLKSKGLEMNKTAPVYKINPDGGKTKDESTGWFKRTEKKNGTETKPALAVNVSKNLPSTVKSELQ